MLVCLGGDEGIGGGSGRTIELAIVNDYSDFRAGGDEAWVLRWTEALVDRCIWGRIELWRWGKRFLIVGSRGGHCASSSLLKCDSRN